MYFRQLNEAYEITPYEISFTTVFTLIFSIEHFDCKEDESNNGSRSILDCHTWRIRVVGVRFASNLESSRTSSIIQTTEPVIGGYIDEHYFPLAT